MSFNYQIFKRFLNVSLGVLGAIFPQVFMAGDMEMELSSYKKLKMDNAQWILNNDERVVQLESFIKTLKEMMPESQ